jgi:TorA maturation chaperone TorD
MNEGLATHDVSRIRANVFRMAGGLFLAEPSRELLTDLAVDETWEIMHLLTERDGYQPLRELAQSGTLSLEDLRLEFHALFTVPLGCYIFPFESCYRVAKPPGPLMGPPAIEVQSAYAAAGFAIAPETLEPPDHIGLELSFVAELLDRHATALETFDGENSALVAGQIHSFCTGHLNCWLPQLRDRIRDGGSSAFYTAAATLAADLVRKLLLDEPEASNRG